MPRWGKSAPRLSPASACLTGDSEQDGHKLYSQMIRPPGQNFNHRRLALTDKYLYVYACVVVNV